MTRDELIKAAINGGVWANKGELEHDLPILEPIIRADERERTNTVGGHRQIRDEGRADMCADLRAEVEALHNDAIRRGDTYDINDVLALFDGGSNE